MKQILLLYLLLQGISFGSLITVCPVGDCDFQVIQDAIDSIPDSTASDQDTILVEQGTYFENLLIQSSIVLMSRAVYTPIELNNSASCDSDICVHGALEGEACSTTDDCIISLEEYWQSWVVLDENGKWEIQNDDLNRTIIDASQRTRGLKQMSGIMVNSHGDQFERTRAIARPSIFGFTIQNGVGTSVQSHGDQFERGSDSYEMRGGGLYANNALPTVNFNSFNANGHGDQFERLAGGVISKGGHIFLGHGDQFERDDNFDLKAIEGEKNILREDDWMFAGYNVNNNGNASYGNNFNTNWNGNVDMSWCYSDVTVCDGSRNFGPPSPPWNDDGPEDANITYDNFYGALCSITEDVWVSIEGDDENYPATNSGSAFQTLERAIEMIAPSEGNAITINLAGGTEVDPAIYSPDTTDSNGEPFPIIMYSNIHIKGEGEDVTIIDADSTAKVFLFEFSENNKISDLTVMGGYSQTNNDGPDPYRAKQGAGMFIFSSSIEIERVTVKENIGVSGAALYMLASNAILDNVTIEDNEAYNAGGILTDNSDLHITNSIIKNNIATDSGENELGLGKGGGLRIRKLSNVSISQSRITSNNAVYGGGIFIDNDSQLDLMNVLILDNNASRSCLGDLPGGAALYIENSDVDFNNVSVLFNSTFDDPVDCETDPFNGQHIEAIFAIFDSKINMMNTTMVNNYAETEILLNFQSLAGLPTPELNVDFSALYAGANELYLFPVGYVDPANGNVGPYVSANWVENEELGEGNVNIVPDGSNLGVNGCWEDDNWQECDFNLIPLSNGEPNPCIDGGNPNNWYDDLDDGSRNDMGWTGGSFLSLDCNSLPYINSTEYDFGEVGSFSVTHDLHINNYGTQTFNFSGINFISNYENCDNGGCSDFYSPVTQLDLNPMESAIIPITCSTINMGSISDRMFFLYQDDTLFIDLFAEGSTGNSLAGALSGNLSESTYNITGDVYVRNNDTLRIAAGAQFLFSGENSFEVNGVLKAEGAEGNPIIFDDANAEDDVKWKGLALYDQTEETILEHVRISNAHKYAGGGISLRNSSPTINYLTLSNNSAAIVGGGMLIAGGDEILLSNVNIHDNIAGTSGSFGGGGGLWAEYTLDLTIEHSKIINNETLAQDAGGIMIKSSGNPSLRYVEITGNKSPQGGGLVFDSNLGANIINSTISANEALVGSGIYIYDSIESNIVNTIIQDNQPETASSISLSYEQSETMIIFHSNIEPGCIDLPGLDGEEWSDGYNGCEWWGAFGNYDVSTPGDYFYDPDYAFSDNCYAWQDSTSLPNGNPSEYCCACGGGQNIDSWYTEASGNMNNDPLFVQTTNPATNFSLGEGSNSIDAGTNSFAVNNVVIIHPGEIIYNGNAPDLGAYESTWTMEEIVGCTDEAACNYNPNANTADNSCTYPGSYDCDGNCIAEIDCFDVCGGGAVIDACGICGGDSTIDDCVTAGDVNIDGVLNVVDLVLIIDYILGQYSFSDEQIVLADYNGDGNIDIADIVGLIESMFNLLGRVLEYADEITIIKTNDGLYMESSGFIALDIQISHLPSFEYELTSDAFLSKGVTNENSTRMIIADPESDLIFNADNPYTIDNITAVTTGGEAVKVNIISITDFKLLPAYPNPFNPVTTFNFAIPKEVDVTMKVYDLQGRVVETLLNSNMTVGYHSIAWNADNYSSGIYFVQILAGEYMNTQKLMLVK